MTGNGEPPSTAPGLSTVPETGLRVSGVVEVRSSSTGPLPVLDGVDSAPGEPAARVSGSMAPIPTGRVGRRPSREGNRFDHRQRFRAFDDA